MKKEVALGIDIGGTNTAFGFIDKEGNYLAEGNIASNTHKDINDYLKELHCHIENVFDTIREHSSLVGIGIGAPCGNYLAGTIEHASNLNWKGIIPFCELLQQYYPSIPIRLTNDANAATIGEMIYGGSQGMKDFIMVTLGTGVGSGFVSNGQLISGHDGFAGELGHIIVTPHGRQCGCGRQGCLETYVSATGVKRTAFEMMAIHNEPSELRAIPFQEMTSKIIYEAAVKGDAIALKTFQYTAQKLGEALANILSGKVSPSGKLSNTWVKDYSDIPNGNNYGPYSLDQDNYNYYESIYVGYRYYDSFNVDVMYPFGYGLSYSNFKIQCKDIVVLKGKEINFQRSVSGALSFSGKMIYTKPQLQCNNLSSKQ